MPNKMQEYIELINKNLDKFLNVQYPQEIFESMRYSVLAEGKRLRPVLCLEACRVFGGNIQDAIPTACAIEMLHAQSLIHDDLPCMDNDDFRRGKPTNHKVFGEATAVLAGDALLSFAPQVILQQSKNLSDSVKIRLLEEYCVAAGAYGLIAGQVVDIQSEGKKIPPKTLEFIHTHKTADLFKFALKAGAIIACGSRSEPVSACDKQVEQGELNDSDVRVLEQSDKNSIGANASEAPILAMQEFAQKLGFAFQICDDILDETSTFEQLGKTLGKDKQANKPTFTALYGLKKAREEVVCLLNQAYDIMAKHDIKSEIFNEILDGIKERADSC